MRNRGLTKSLGDLSLQMNGKVAQQPVERQISELAVAQHGVVTRAQLRELGLGDTGVDHRIRDGRLHSLHRGVFAVRHPMLPAKGRWMAAVLAVGDGAVLSHLPAAALWDVRASSSAVVDVTVPTRNGRARRRGIVVHRSALAPADVTRRDRIPVTTLARTLLDLAEVVTRRTLERTLDEAERLRLLDLETLAAVVARNSGRPGAATLSSILGTHAPGATITKSELEERFLELCRAHSLPSPAVNARVGKYVVDFLWRKQRLIVETDGHASHGTRGAFEEDRARDAWLTVAGWRVVRFTYRQVTDEPGKVARILGALLVG